MVKLTTTSQGPFRRVFCVLLAIALVIAFTFARAVLNPILGSQSPFMLYVAAVLIAGFARGGFCGFLVMLGGGACGLTLFCGWDGHAATLGPPAASLICFWAVSALGLMLANELRRHADRTFDRLRVQTEAVSARNCEQQRAA